MATTTAARIRQPAPQRRRPSGWSMLLVPAAVLVVTVFAYPLTLLLVRSFGEPSPGMGNYQALWSSGVFRTVLIRTFVTALVVCAVCLLLGYPYAYLMTVVSRRWRDVMIVVVLLPFWTSLMVRTFAWLVLLQDNGAVNRALGGVGLGPLHLIRNTTGVVIGMAQVMLPFAVLPLYAAMLKIDRRLLDAAAACGARPAAAFLRVYVPLSAPGVTSGMSLVFILSLGFFITPQILGSPSNALLSQLLYTQITQLSNWGAGAAMGFSLLVAALAVLLLVRAGRLVSELTVGRGARS